MLLLDNISKSFGPNSALCNVSLCVGSGEIVAVIGPNGAGKSTLFNIVAGVIKADGGTCLLDNVTLSSVSLKTIGFLPEKPFYYGSFTTLETIRFEQTMREIKDSTSRFDELMIHFGIKDHINSKMNCLSQGMAKRVALVCAFIGNPRVIILDEPLNGLDIQSVIGLKEQLILEKQRGTSILISSHVLTFLDGLVDRIVFLDKGELALESSNNDDIENAYKRLFIQVKRSN
jgi:ABC-2 type transport system ATP-binding protein